MNLGALGRSLILFFVFLLVALFSVNFAAAENSNLNGNVLTIYNSTIEKDKSYTVVVQHGEEKILEETNKSIEPGKLTITNDKLNHQKIQYELLFNNSPLQQE